MSWWEGHAHEGWEGQKRKGGERMAGTLEGGLELIELVIVAHGWCRMKATRERGLVKTQNTRWKGQ